MATISTPRATIDDLYRVDGKAELIAGRIVHLSPSGYLPSVAAFWIARSLHDHAQTSRQGLALGDGVGYHVRETPSGRESFCPDASFYTGPLPANPMRFIEGPPTFAAEVRSEGDYGPAAEAQMAAKRADYFAAGTLAVWDVDPIAQTVTAYRADAPHNPTVFRRGDTADGEPAVPGWRIAVADLFPVR